MLFSFSLNSKVPLILYLIFSLLATIYAFRSAPKGKLIFIACHFEDVHSFHIFSQIFLVIHISRWHLFLFEKNVYNFSISSWQASPSLLQLTQFRTDSFSRAGISSVFVSCRPKLANNSEDIFFCIFFISFFSR